MTKPPIDHGKGEGKDDLLDRLEGIGAASLRSGVAKVEGISKDDEENHSRWLNTVKKRTVSKLTSWFLHFLFIVTCLIVLILFLGTTWLTYVWVSSFINDADAVGELLGRLWEIGLIALATLFVQNVWPK